MKKLFLLLISALCVTDGLFAQVLVPSQLPNHTQKLLIHYFLKFFLLVLYSQVDIYN